MSLTLFSSLSSLLCWLSLALTLTLASLTLASLTLAPLTLALASLTLALASLTLALTLLSLALTLLSLTLALLSLTLTLLSLTLALLSLDLTLLSLALALLPLVVVHTISSLHKPFLVLILRHVAILLVLRGRRPGPCCSDDFKLGTIVLSSALGDRHGDGLVVLGCNHGADAVRAGRKSAVDHCLQKTLAIAGIIDTLEEGKFARVGWGARVQRADVLDGDVAVANDVSVIVKVLGRRVVVGRRVDKVAGLEMNRLD